MFKLKEDVSESAMLNATKIVDQEFLSKEDGFYADLAFATTKEKAEEICSKWMNNEFTLKYLDFIDPESVNMFFWAKIK